MWSAALSLLTGGFSKLFGMVPAFLRWCFANPAWVICAVLGLLWGLSSIEARKWRKQADHCAAARVADQAAWKAAYAKAVADDAAHIAAVKARDDQITQEKTHALETQLVDARTAVARYARLHAAPGANQGSAGAATVPAASDPASAVDGASEQAIVSVADLNVCADNTVKAQGWQDWWTAVSAAPR